MENKVVFIDGVNVFTPNEKAPDFVKASLVINPTKLIAWLKENDQHLTEGKEGLELRTQIKESKQGKLYAAVDTYEPKLKAEVTSKAVAVDDGDLPF
jgi:hypothetical protein